MAWFCTIAVIMQMRSGFNGRTAAVSEPNGYEKEKFFGEPDVACIKTFNAKQHVCEINTDVRGRDRISPDHGYHVRAQDAVVATQKDPCVQMMLMMV
jgi:hypothetical protein